MAMWLRRIRGWFEQKVAWGYSSCDSCGRPWKFAPLHSTRYSECHGCFVLCEHCWTEMSVEERRPAYERLLEKWRVSGHPLENSQAEALLQAVDRGE